MHLPGIKGKVMAVIGMRRSGKTTFLWQCLADRLEAGTPRDALLRSLAASRGGTDVCLGRFAQSQPLHTR